jgi:hypothetical protein
MIRTLKLYNKPAGTPNHKLFSGRHGLWVGCELGMMGDLKTYPGGIPQPAHGALQRLPA